ncbi:hypothetical protein JRQ81_001727, partial [Phrynocephalus forsythii]
QGNLLLKNSGESEIVNGKRYLGHRDTGSLISIAHPDIIPVANIISGKISLKGITKEIVKFQVTE